MTLVRPGKMTEEAKEKKHVKIKMSIPQTIGVNVLTKIGDQHDEKRKVMGGYRRKGGKAANHRSRGDNKKGETQWMR